MNQDNPHLPRNFRKLSMDEKRDTLRRVLGLSEQEADYLAVEPGLLELADAMVESAVGVLPIPLGIAAGFLIDGRRYDIPIATEEPSVIAAASYAGQIIARGGGIRTATADPLMTAQVYLANVSESGEAALRSSEREIRASVAGTLERMEARGGGYRGFDVTRFEEFVRLQIHVDVRDAMGANVLNTAAEALRPVACRISGGRGIMAILSNAAEARRTTASFDIPVSLLGRGGYGGGQAAERVATGSRIAALDPTRAVTQNKGIMNGISGLALATGNDTRGLEAAVHAYAARDGVYRPLSAFEVRGDRLTGRLELPVPLATVGGAVSFHPVAEICLKLLGSPKATELARIAAALGLAQNFAAVYALVTEGIQRGHMSKHAQRVAWRAGARGADRDVVAEKLVSSGRFDVETAQKHLGGPGNGR